jgi:ABC-type molybdate transport system substrate-binding protein
MKTLSMKILGVFLAAALAALLSTCSRQNGDRPLLCFVGGTMRPAMEELVKMYQEKHPLKVDVDYAESGELYVRLDQTHKGDLLVCHDPFGGAALKKKLVTLSLPVATLDPVIVVAKGNPKQIHGLKDLANPGIKVIFTHEMYNEMNLVPRMAERAGIRKPLDANCASFSWGGGESANELSLGAADASIVWNAVAALRTDIVDMVPIERSLHLQSNTDAITCATYGTVDLSTIKVTINVVRWSKHVEPATAFARFCASDDAQKVWTKYGFSARREMFMDQ